MSICTECKKRSTCQDLCKEAESYVDQDNISQKEITFSELGVSIGAVFDKEFSELMWPEELSCNHTKEYSNFPFLTSLENKIISMFYLQGLSYSQIAIAMSGNNKGKISRRAVKHHLSKARAEIVSFNTYNR